MTPICIIVPVFWVLYWDLLTFFQNITRLCRADVHPRTCFTIRNNELLLPGICVSDGSPPSQHIYHCVILPGNSYSQQQWKSESAKSCSSWLQRVVSCICTSRPAWHPFSMVILHAIHSPIRPQRDPEFSSSDRLNPGRTNCMSWCQIPLLYRNSAIINSLWNPAISGTSCHMEFLCVCDSISCNTSWPTSFGALQGFLSKHECLKGTGYLDCGFERALPFLYIW